MADLTQISVEPDALAALLTDGKKPTLVDFWAPWCGTCKLMAGSILRLSEERAADIRVVGMNLDDGHEAALSYGVQSLPTLLIFKEGEEVARLNGLKSYETLKSEIDKVLA